MKKLLILFFVISFFLPLFAQDSKSGREITVNSDDNRKKAIEKIQELDDTVKVWKITGLTSLNVGATGLFNWFAGGNSSFNMIAAADFYFLYYKNHIAWESNINTEFGEAWVDNNKHSWQKTNDKLEISTKFGWEFSKHWYLTLFGQFRTQYANGFDYSKDELSLISQFMSPSYTDLSAGIDWKPNSIFSVYFSPVSGRFTTCISNDSILKDTYLGQEFMATRRERGENPTARADLGMSIKGSVFYDGVKNLKIISTVNLFTPYNKNFGNFDVDWDVTVSYQFLKVLNVSLGTQLKYYDSVKMQLKDDEYPTQHVQFKGQIGLGIGYSF
ncbi:MAG: DUF3078 domain-containing protein [Paludibacteraceae bacterium]|nr:DUF3078 domain-containing protein [Paludibacteraceae bacterium]